MNVLETEWWSLALPPEWWADSEEDSILIGDRDDVGCIEISYPAQGCTGLSTQQTVQRDCPGGVRATAGLAACHGR